MSTTSTIFLTVDYEVWEYDTYSGEIEINIAPEHFEGMNEGCYRFVIKKGSPLWFKLRDGLGIYYRDNLEEPENFKL